MGGRYTSNMRPVYLIDLDNTLVYNSEYPTGEASEFFRSTRRLHEGHPRRLAADAFELAARKRALNSFVLRHKTRSGRTLKETWKIVPRPGIRAALNRWQRSGDLLLLTAADINYARATLRALGLRGCFKGVYSTRVHGANELRPHLKGRPWVLVDDLPHSRSHTKKKLKMAHAASGLSGGLILIQPWGPSSFFSGVPFEAAL